MVDGDAELPGTDTLFPLVYDELKRLARRHRRSVGAGSTLCTTELVHEAFFKLSASGGASWDGRAHFFGAASRAMRQVLVDFARRRKASKRGENLELVTLSDAGSVVELQLEEILELDTALDKLNAVAPRLRLVVELRFFCGLSEDEIGRALGVSTRTVGRDWLKARLFLLEELAPIAQRLQ
jgi:RNA polymerase sigma factor (TIGR02999 family)